MSTYYNNFMYANDNNSDDLQHYGILGMRWGRRRLFYKTYSAKGLQKSGKRVKKDIYKAKIKKARLDKKAAKYMAKGDYKKASKYMKKSYKREKNSLHNEKLLALYKKRLKNKYNQDAEFD